MLVYADTLKQVDSLPYRETHTLILRRLTAGQLAAARAEIGRLVGNARIVTAGWLPGADWWGTPLWPLFEHAARQDHGLAARMYGLLFMEHFANREGETWYTGRYELNGRPISSRTYFRSDLD